MTIQRQNLLLVFIPVAMLFLYLLLGKHPQKVDTAPPAISVSTFSIPGKTGYKPKLPKTPPPR